jgi:hypothetical protein
VAVLPKVDRSADTVATEALPTVAVILAGHGPPAVGGVVSLTVNEAIWPKGIFKLFGSTSWVKTTETITKAPRRTTDTAIILRAL